MVEQDFAKICTVLANTAPRCQNLPQRSSKGSAKASGKAYRGRIWPDMTM